MSDVGVRVDVVGDDVASENTDRAEAARRLGAALKRVRERDTNLNGAELARGMGEPQPKISDWENGKKLIQLWHVERAEDALGVIRGTILAEAGYVSLPSASIRTLIATDGELGPDHRRWMVEQYDSSWRRSHSLGDGDTVGQH